MAHQFFFNPYIIENLPLPQKGFDVVQDLSEPKLRMYITQHGVKSFFVRKRINGVDKRIILGKYPDMDIETARSMVNTVLDNACKKQVKYRKKIKFRDFLNVYIENKVKRSEDSLIKLKRSIDMHFGEILDLYIQDITTNDIAKVLDNITGRAMAARLQEFLHSAFNYAKLLGYIKNNIVNDVPQIKVKRRVRPLTEEILKELIATIKAEDYSVCQSAFLMLIYGFAPKTKIFKMRWEDIDFNHDLWKDMPLSDKAMLLLQEIPQESEWIFTGRGKFHLADPRITWQRIVAKIGVPNLTMDDVYKFLTRLLVWDADREKLRENMNDLLSRF
ncbi:MAG: hypothetical protein MJ158_01090 [Alphaproteobacteria bacterium]|nr:hypothetical protein [Alphaproteobacteria bacterium]